MGILIGRKDGFRPYGEFKGGSTKKCFCGEMSYWKSNLGPFAGSAGHFPVRRPAAAVSPAALGSGGSADLPGNGSCFILKLRQNNQPTTRNELRSKPVLVLKK
jgi:hypothetical protein